MQITKCFEVLQVESNAPWQVVKNSYYNLAKKLHPDLNSSSTEAETRLKEINVMRTIVNGKTIFINPEVE